MTDEQGGGVEPDFALLDDVLARAKRPFGDAAWGVGGAFLGLLAVLLGWLSAALVIVFVAQFGFGLDATAVQESLLLRYGLVIASQAVLLVVAFGGALLVRARPSALGFRSATAVSLAEGALLGLAAFVFGVLYERGLAIGWPAGHRALMEEVERQMSGLAGPLPLLLIAAVGIAPLAEEVFFRGYLYGGLRTMLTPRVAIGVSALCFACAHVMIWSIVPLFAVGVAAAWTYERRQTIAAPLAVHATFNFISVMAGALFPEG